MIAESKSPVFFLCVVRAIGLLVPAEFRSEWRREWEAEVINRWLLLEKWDRLNAQSKVDLWKKTRGALVDALWFQQRRTQLLLVMLNVMVALSTGFGAAQEFIVRGIGDRQRQPLLLSLVAIIVSLLFITSGIALLRRWPTARRLITLTGTLSILLHVYGVLPPHRNMGFVVLIVGAGYGLVMLVVFAWNEKRKLVS
jgi:hypothetical protein